MTGRSPARLLAPAALVAAAIALFFVVASGGGDQSAEREASPTPAATAEPTPERKKKAEPSGETYVVEAGDTPSSIAAEQGVDLDALLEVNPEIDPDGLVIGEELQLP